MKIFFFSCVIISENLFKPFLFVKISFYLCFSIINLLLFMLICESLFYYVYFRDVNFEMHFLREQFWSAPMFWNKFFEGVIILIFWFIAADKCGCCFMLLWRLISVAAVPCFLLKSAYLLKSVRPCGQTDKTWGF